MLDTYDYSTARVMFNSLRRGGRDIPRVALVGSTEPWGPGSTPQASKVWVVTLSGYGSGEIQARILKFQNCLETGTMKGAPSELPQILTLANSFFTAMGKALADFSAASGKVP